MSTLQEKLENKTFAITAELEPPKGTSITKFIQKAHLVKDWVHSVNVTDNQRAMLRLSSASGCALLKNLGIDPVFQVTSRDRNRLAIQSDLLGINALGVRNVLAISGDYPTLGDHPGAKIVYDVDSVHILEIITMMNKGLDMRNHALDGATDIFPGAVFNSNTDLIEPQLFKIKLKIEQGARFFQTQIIYDVEKFKEFLDLFPEFGISRENIYILAGILPLRSAKNARFIHNNVPGIHIPEWMIEKLDSASNPAKMGFEMAGDLINQLKEVCEGIHIMTVGREEIIPDLLTVAGFEPNNHSKELNSVKG